MIHLTQRTEFSFRTAAGRINQILDLNPDAKAAGICDRHGTWGHLPWERACEERGIQPIFGVELLCVIDASVREKQKSNYVKLIAKSNAGLKELYEIVSMATENFFYTPRIDYGMAMGASSHIVVLLGPHPDWDQLPSKLPVNFYFELNQSTSPKEVKEAVKRGAKFIASDDNYFPTPSDRDPYQMVLGMFADDRTVASHILTEDEFMALPICSGPRWADAIQRSKKFPSLCSVKIPKTVFPVPEKPKTLRQMCVAGAKFRGCDLKDPVYKERLKYELDLIKDKNFGDYFYVVSDLVAYAKQHMLVGPARGSSCGSLVCWLIGITDIDPIPFGLLFERFIDVNRSDYPDIDIDFADDKRSMVFTYLQEKYGPDCVAKLGTVSRFKPKSAITDSSKALGIPKWEVDELKNSIIERSSGDARAADCIRDTFTDTDIGKKIMDAYPELAICAEIEGHARHTGVHAAAIILTNDPLSNYCSIDDKTGAAMLEKTDTEYLGLLKIDVLGLRTLSVIGDCLDQVGMTKADLDAWTLEDKKAFDVLNDYKFSGIFQFEGQALQNIIKQMKVESFEDIVSVTALARPGPLASGGTSDFIERRTGVQAITHLSPEMEEETKLTYGVVVYQEQVIRIARSLGKLSWADTTNLRKAMSKSLGEEFFNKYWLRFREGAMSTGMEEGLARTIWDNINTMGSWAFNRSHAVAYGMMSYWACVLKAHHPLEWAAACLRHAKDDEQSVKILRELVNEGYTYSAKSEDSDLNWLVDGDNLIGPLQGIKGIGPKLALDIVKRRKEGKLTPRQKRLLKEGKTPWDSVFPARDYWGHVRDNPLAYNITSPLVDIDSLTENTEGEFVFIARMIDRGTRDQNEEHKLKKRGGKRVASPTKYLNVIVEDDTGSIMVQINRFKYVKWGVPLIEKCDIGDWFLFKGDMSKGIRILWGNRWVKMTGNKKFEKSIK